MKDFLGKSAYIVVIRNDKELNFTAKEVTSVSDTHITFLDKFNEVHTFRITDIIEITEKKEVMK